jgi:hypothetical protein
MTHYKLIIESPQEIDYILEEKNTTERPTLYIEGPFLMADSVNRNNRIYRSDEMITEVKRYDTDMIRTCRALGELNHPTSVEVNPERACHLITKLEQRDNIWVGKSKVLTETPMGKIVHTLLMDKVKLGVSSRALGETIEESGHTIVNNFRLIAVDVVHDPSVNTAFVNGILESKEWVLTDHGILEASYDKLKRNLSVMPRHGADKSLLIAEQIKSFLKSL